MASNEEIIERAIAIYLDAMAEEVLSFARINLVQHDTIDSSRLYNSGHIERGDGTVAVVFDAPHAIWIEYGTQPHPTSMEGRLKIKGWARRKLNLSEADAESASWAIVKKIAEEGMEPNPFLRPAVDFVLAKERLI